MHINTTNHALPAPDSAHPHYQLVEKAIAYLREHQHQQPQLPELAHALSCSESYLQRVFSEWAGISPKRFLQFLSKEYALTALQQQRDILSISDELGLSSPSRVHDLIINCEAVKPGDIQRRGLGLQLLFGYGNTPFGLALIGWHAQGICYLAFIDNDGEQKRQEMQALFFNAHWQENTVAAHQQLNRIFSRTPQRGQLNLLLQGTNFQIKVWQALIRYPVGQALSYSQLAQTINAPRAQRAVGSAVAANHIAWLIPCHRVIRESGELGQYRWGINRKAAILGWEAAKNEAGKVPSAEHF